MQNASFDGIGSYKVKDQAVFLLAITMDASHPLLQPVGVPGNIVVKENIANLQVNTFSSRFSSYQYLDGTLTKELLGIETGAGLITRPRAHPPVDISDTEPPSFKLIHKVVECISKLRKYQKTLLWIGKETLLMQQFV